MHILLEKVSESQTSPELRAKVAKECIFLKDAIKEVELAAIVGSFRFSLFIFISSGRVWNVLNFLLSHLLKKYLYMFYESYICTAAVLSYLGCNTEHENAVAEVESRDCNMESFGARNSTK